MPSITSTSASPVHKSRITREHGPPDDRPPRRSSRRRSACRRPWRRRARRLPWRIRRCGAAGPALEEAEELAVRAQDERGILAGQRVAVGLQRAVEGEELLVLAECLGVDLDRLGIAV